VSIRTGLGYDSHRFVPGRRLVIGGVAVPFDLGLDGHSDADVLTHAVIDALLGAAGLGDIGEHFPDTDPRYRDADSIGLLQAAVQLVGARGFGVMNVDATVIIERPHLREFKPQMRSRLAGALGIASDAVNVKATRGEGMGFIGRGEGAAALAIANLTPLPPDAQESAPRA
jgi:2-C-methyl-D-erythritol 2,4-cyclodiphosphate synthase